MMMFITLCFSSLFFIHIHVFFFFCSPFFIMLFSLFSFYEYKGTNLTVWRVITWYSTPELSEICTWETVNLFPSVTIFFLHFSIFFLFFYCQSQLMPTSAIVLSPRRVCLHCHLKYIFNQVRVSKEVRVETAVVLLLYWASLWPQSLCACQAWRLFMC